jgi:hypothetical protein
VGTDRDRLIVATGRGRGPRCAGGHAAGAVRPLAPLAKDLAEWRLACSGRLRGRAGLSARGRQARGATTTCGTGVGASTSRSLARSGGSRRGHMTCAVRSCRCSSRRAARWLLSGRRARRCVTALDAERTQQLGLDRAGTECRSAKFLLRTGSPLSDSNRRPLPYHGSRDTWRRALYRAEIPAHVANDDTAHGGSPTHHSAPSVTHRDPAGPGKLASSARPSPPP